MIKSLEPYFQLSRWDKPVGTWLLFLPTAWGVALAGGGVVDLIHPLTLIGAGSVLMRGAGCTINDMLDRDIDKKVARTAVRPLASGELNLIQATWWLLFQILGSFLILIQLNSPCFLVGFLDLIPVALYPTAKRLTYWPQAVLGLTFNQILFGYAASSKFAENGYFTVPWLQSAPILLYLAATIWTIVYDTIYAYQDVKDDKKLGVGSTALYFGDDHQIWLFGLTFVSIVLFLACGFSGNLNWPYYIAVAMAAQHIQWQILTLDPGNVENCAERFKSNVTVGFVILLGLIASNYVE